MLYLEDFLELIEPLPMELRDRSTEMRILDLQVQRGLDQLSQTTRDFFASAEALSKEERERKYARLKDEYKKIREQAEDKVAIADAMSNIVEKYYNRLNRDLMQFKCDLDHDNPGITDTIEKKLADAERMTIAAKKEKRKRQLTETKTENGGDMVSLFDGESSGYGGRAAMPSLIDIVADPSLLQPPTKIGPNMKRSSTYSTKLSLPTSSSMVALGGADRDRWISHSPSPMATPSSSKGGGGPTTPAIMPGSLSMLTSHESRHGRPRKLTSRVQEMFNQTVSHHRKEPRQSTAPSTESDVSDGSDGDDDFEQEDAKRTWCFCNQKSYGDMVACDNKDCPYEWFHYHCVGITAPPKGKWFCPHCTGMRQRSKSVTSTSEN